MENKPMTVEFIRSKPEILDLRERVQDILNDMIVPEFIGMDRWSFVQGILSTIDCILDEKYDSSLLVGLI